MIALIPARAGSQRIRNKNIRDLAGHPLIAYTIAAARESRCFSHVFVVANDPSTISIANCYGATVIGRSKESSTATAPDILWVQDALRSLFVPRFEDFCILRATSPFRGAKTIQRAVGVWAQEGKRLDSLRAVAPVTQHPGKMWICRGAQMVPLLGLAIAPETPWHSSPTQTLPQVYAQTAGLEITWRATVALTGTLSGMRVRPFAMNRWEAHDLNDEHDWIIAEHMIATGQWTLPVVS